MRYKIGRVFEIIDLSCQQIKFTFSFERTMKKYMTSSTFIFAMESRRRKNSIASHNFVLLFFFSLSFLLAISLSHRLFLPFILNQRENHISINNNNSENALRCICFFINCIKQVDTSRATVSRYETDFFHTLEFLLFFAFLSISIVVLCFCSVYIFSIDFFYRFFHKEIYQINGRISKLTLL